MKELLLKVFKLEYGKSLLQKKGLIIYYCPTVLGFFFFLVCFLAFFTLRSEWICSTRSIFLILRKHQETALKFSAFELQTCQITGGPSGWVWNLRDRRRGRFAYLKSSSSSVCELLNLIQILRNLYLLSSRC